jgi:hypothetical protein
MSSTQPAFAAALFLVPPHAQKRWATSTAASGAPVPPSRALVAMRSPAGEFPDRARAAHDSEYVLRFVGRRREVPEKGSFDADSSANQFGVEGYARVELLSPAVLRCPTRRVSRI